ncbi:MAG: DUF2135 domain-containing protein [Zoogloeaceae bacterium]|jgi:tetratricopeptide (TPR) repeat protein|nr:DUF2135 domain-containing protein [Zoogloeaceae bacterium]
MKKTVLGLIIALLVSGTLIAAISGPSGEPENREGNAAASAPQASADEASTSRSVPPSSDEPVTPIIPAPPVEFRVPGAEKPIELRELVIESEIFGVFAQTTVEMRFYNPNARVLEGELQFPLADGQTITAFALSLKDAKGKETMREAVPVPKNKGRQVFEAVIRQQIDPALLEVTQGGHFKLRVYPLSPGETRRVRLTYSERLPKVREGGAPRHLYRLPLAYALQPDRLSLSLKTQGEKPVFAAPAGLPLDFQKTSQGWIAQASVNGKSLPAELRLGIPANEKPVYFGEHADKTYFYAEVPYPAGSVKARELPRRIALFWDASLSGSKRRHRKEFAFLDAFFAQARNVTVRLQKLRDAPETPRDFVVKDGDWAALKKELADTLYDGATNLSAMTFTDAVDLNLLFSDGLDNYSVTPLAPPARPLYAVFSAPGADAVRLKRLAEQGALIDLDTLDVQGGLARLTQRRPSVVAVEGEGIAEAVWSAVSQDTVSIAGRVFDPTRPVRVIFAGEDGKTLVAPSDTARFSGVPFLWAALTLERLEADYDLNRGAIRRLGKTFALPTRETSLIVLDRVEDYVTHDIDPPAELKEEYDRLRARMRPADAENQKMERVWAEWEARDAWWRKDFPKDKPKRKTVSKSQREYIMREGPASAAPAPPAPVERRAYESKEPQEALARRRNDSGRAANASKAADSAPADSSLAIQLRPWSSNAPYIARMKALDDEKAYRVYLDERPDYENSVAFYLDVADQFQQRGRRDLALRVLSNLAEIDLENRQILRILGYRLLAAGEVKTAVLIFGRVLHLAEDEPQSWRDLALAHEAAGEYQAAAEHFHAAATRIFVRGFPGIEVIALTEMNAAIEKAREKGVEVDTRAIDPVFLKNRPLDLRVVLSWDSDNTDIDLHVIDPNGEEAFFGHPLSYQGGRVSPDNTVGYGPEEYSLKTAKPGKYRVEVKFYGHRQQIISEATTLQLDFFTRYASGKARKESTTLRLKNAKERVLVGEFEVTGGGKK